MANLLYGSICVSDIPKNLFKKVQCKDGSTKIFLNIKVVERKEVGQFGHTHFISCEPFDEKERVEGTNYLCGDLKTYTPKNNTPSQEQISNSPEVQSNDLPF